MTANPKLRANPVFRFTMPTGERVSPKATTKFEECEPRVRLLLALGHTATCNYPNADGQLVLMNKLFNKISPPAERIEMAEIVAHLEVAQVEEQAVYADGSWALGPCAGEVLDEFITKSLWPPANQ